MPHYSVATTKDHLSRLIDRALAGEEVVITRHGTPTVELKVVAGDRSATSANTAWLDRLRRFRETIPAANISWVDEVRAMRDE